MRELYCYFVQQTDDILICTWTAPEHSNSHVRYYLIRLINKRQVLYNNTSLENYFEMIFDAKEGEYYNVNVNAMSNKWSKTTTTTIKYNESGMSPCFSN